jgi:hypothetical protein
MLLIEDLLQAQALLSGLYRQQEFKKTRAHYISGIYIAPRYRRHAFPKR